MSFLKGLQFFEDCDNSGCYVFDEDFLKLFEKIAYFPGEDITVLTITGSTLILSPHFFPILTLRKLHIELKFLVLLCLEVYSFHGGGGTSTKE